MSNMLCSELCPVSLKLPHNFDWQPLQPIEYVHIALQAEHLTETERIHVQQQWAMCNIIALRTEYIAESKGPFLAELVEQDFSVEHTLGRCCFLHSAGS